MTTSIAMGLPGVSLAPGDHICAFYRGPAERDAILVPYLREGLRAGDKCLCVTDDPLPAESVRELAADPGHLESLTSSSTYLLDGFFAIDRMIAFWERAVGRAVDRDGFGFVRAVGEMTWALSGRPGVADLLAYESRLNDFLPRYPQVILCLYDLRRFCDGEVLMDIVRTHPAVLISGQLLDNPWYVEPDEYLSRHPGIAVPAVDALGAARAVP
ncbi:MEDS domain-containing protein [Actinomycetospora endophytica]|uniref:MEDS domain-containing protein n=1 Tax=Actinomycetospora endophytica TaxID=2291215 RepID=A0ABS8P1F3_9PSEU|nr:MEDS domain-containing protein [Actinomycetospora endophytica]MCD2192083.1 MEDS domain-containing protein [Actinomycetospora endophytica]